MITEEQSKILDQQRKIAEEIKNICKVKTNEESITHPKNIKRIRELAQKYELLCAQLETTFLTKANEKP